ncbi:hypothetical protein SELMODRAFT_410286 [Selaginella moellendorffii]|uniref:Alcohol dehydrogenase-like C-terminal domain-containing protein n=1 Tax=Selaginella moellendorffii TaxID=88036 RepID=D8RE98_SELML|nr:hypothetical protein SELMODRAFT_410286 [Selaginella moellendorffii]
MASFGLTIVLKKEKFICQIPKNLSLDGAAPLLCAGITVYSPMKHFVTVISTSPFKEKEACEILGVDNFIVSRDPAQMKNAEKSLDYILDTVSTPHPLDVCAVGSFIGSIKETQDMLNFCGIKNVTSMIKLVPMNYVNEAMKRLRKSVKFWFHLQQGVSLPSQTGLTKDKNLPSLAITVVISNQKTSVQLTVHGNGF